MSQACNLLDGNEITLATENRVRRLVWAFLLLGILARSVRYFLCFPLWDDECFLCFNFIDRGYMELLQPLQFHQVAPWLFLWIEATMVKLFGFSELILRLFPFLCSIGSLFLFRALVRRFLKGSALVLAIAVFAVAYPGIRYAGEAKQYASDLFVSLALLNLVVYWWQRPENTKPLWWLVAVMPIAISLSYPAIFIAGGVSIVVIYQLWSTGQRTGRGIWLCLNCSMLLGVGLIYVLCARHQTAAELAWMQHYWQRSFPPIHEMSQLLKWMLLTHSGSMFAYPVGADAGASALTLLCFLLSIIFLLRQRQARWLLLCLVPMGLHFLAACLKRYPYGEHPKFSQYLAPLICSFMGLGIALMLGWWKTRPKLAQRFFVSWLVGLALVGVGSMARDIIRPYKTKADMRLRAFSRYFWPNMAFENEVVCINRDLGQVFSPISYQELNYVAMYACNRQIYSPRHHQRQPFQPERVSASHPLRCVRFVEPRIPQNKVAVEQWLNSMKVNYDFIGVERIPFPRYNKHEQHLINLSYVEIYTFVPHVGTTPVTHQEN